MPTYEFSCESCDAHQLHAHSIHDTVPTSYDCHCGGVLRRVWTVPHINLFPEQWNDSLGVSVGSKSGLKEELKRKSADLTELSGFNTNLVEVGYEDIKHTLTEEGMSATHRKRRELGLEERERSYFYD